MKIQKQLHHARDIAVPLECRTDVMTNDVDFLTPVRVMHSGQEMRLGFSFAPTLISTWANSLQGLYE